LRIEDWRVREEENVIRYSLFVIRFRKAIKNRGRKKTRNAREGVAETMRNNGGKATGNEEIR
jgi:hypothetical protein